MLETESTKIKHQAVKKRVFRTFEDAREYARTLKLKTSMEWKEHYLQNGLPEGIPKVPIYKYKSKGWVSWVDWLGSSYIGRRKKNGNKT